MKLKLTMAGLCTLALFVWGAHTKLMLIAVPMMLVLEGRHFVRQPRHLSLNDLKGICQLCGGIFAALLISFLITQRSFSVIYLLLQSLPICVFPLIVAQTYASSLPQLLRLFFTDSYVLRTGFSWHQKPINLYYPYFALCLLSASAANYANYAFSGDLYRSIVMLVALIFWRFRPRRSTPILWVFLFLLASGMGFLGQNQLHQLQAKLEQQTAPWLSGLSGDAVDPYQANTRMGSIEDLKQSNAIVFRVRGDRTSFPLLLREATYNKYGSASWIATQSKFAPIFPLSDGKTWNLSPVTTPSPAITVSSHLSNGQGILKLPNGTSEIGQLNVDRMTKNQYGTVKVEGGQGAIAYQVQFNSKQSGDGLPTVDDLQIPQSELPAIQKTLKTINLKGKSNPEVLDQVSAYFEKNFQYSLRRSDANQSSTPLSSFLLKSHSGHCEYFASATTLLLRGAGIPARYAVGYSVDEFSSLEGQYVVRSRDAHAWVMAYVNGTWQSVDTTPSSWGAQEDAAASPLQAIADWWAFVSFKLAGVGIWAYFGGAIAPIIGFWLWKWSRRVRVRKLGLPARILPESVMAPPQTGIDSEFYEIEKTLDKLTLNRAPAEPLQAWIARLKAQLPDSEFQMLQRIIALHNRYRFDPHGIDASERKTLRSLSQAWLERSHQLNVHKQK
jgi:protein-glutamine gamma-glutamyltransferase